MPRVWLDDRLCKRGDLPDVCLKCGQPATDRVKKTFTWMSPWIYILLLFGALGLIIFLILAATMRKTVKAQMPMCERHRNHWKARLLLVLLGLVAVIGVIVLVVASLDSLPPGDVRDLLPLTIVAAILAWLIGAIVASLTSIRAAEINDARGLQLTGVCEEFIDAYEEAYGSRRAGRVDRAALERWEDRDERRPSGPSRPAERSDRYREEDEEDDRRRSKRDRYSDDY
jgi:hypothetical protein